MTLHECIDMLALYADAMEIDPGLLAITGLMQILRSCVQMEHATEDGVRGSVITWIELNGRPTVDRVHAWVDKANNLGDVELSPRDMAMATGNYNGGKQ